MRAIATRIDRRAAFVALLAVIAAYAAVAVLAGWDAVTAVQGVEQAQHELGGVLRGGALATVSRAQVTGAARRLDGAAGRLRRDERVLAPLFLPMHMLGWVPGIGTALAEAPDLLTLTRDVAQGGAELAHGVEPLLAETEAGAGPRAIAAPAETAGEQGDDQAPAARLERALAAGAVLLQHGDRLLNRAADRRARLHSERYGGPFSSLRRRVQQLDADLPYALQRADALALLPDASRLLLGFDGPRTYAVLGQDSAELRPTGGFIGSAGLVTFDQGRLVFQEYGSSYDFDNPNVPPLPPPAPLARYLGAGAWLMRDANWSPDFPAVARQVQQFIASDLGIDVDGVIAFDNDAVSDLLRAVGPLAVPGIVEQVTADNWFDLTTRAIFTGPRALVEQLQDYQQAKGAGLGAVLQVVLAKAQAARGEELLGVVDALRAAALGNHLLLAFDEQQPADWAHAIGADGALFPAPSGDVVAPVEANLGYSKVGPYVERGLEYEVWLDAGGLPRQARLSLNLRNTVDQTALMDPTIRLDGSRWLPDEGRFVPVPGLLLDYLRLYLTAGATVSDVTGLDDPSLTEEGGYTALAGMLALDPGSGQAIVVDELLAVRPASTGIYELTLVKQPGVDRLPARVTVHPAAGTHLTMLPPGASVEGDAIVLDLTLTAARTRLEYQVARGSGS